jgi:hypothetical protein
MKPRRNRFIREYLLWGGNLAKMGIVFYKSRLLNEFLLIPETSKNADIRLILKGDEISDY